MFQMKFQFLYIWNLVFDEIMLLMFLLTQVLFMCILCQSCQIFSLRNTMKMLFVCGMDVAREQYSVNHYGKHKIVFLDTCFLYLYLPPDWVVQYLGAYNNTGHTCSVR